MDAGRLAPLESRPRPPDRRPDVVTLLPSATEIVCALGVEPVATSHECDYPPEVTSLPTATADKMEADGSSQSINEAVARAEDGEGVFDVRADLLERLDPDLVITQGVCDVCAVDRVLVERVVEERSLDASVVTTDPHHLEDLYDDVRQIGSAIGREDTAEQLVASLQDRAEAVESTVRADGSPTPADATEPPSVAVLDWLDPVMVAGHWMPELVEIAGGTYPLAEAGERSRPREWSEVREADPDALFLSPCGFELDQIVDNLAEVRARPGWDDLAAVRADEVYLLDGHHYVNRPGPRLVDTLEHVAGLLWPEAVDAPPETVARPLHDVVRAADDPSLGE